MEGAFQIRGLEDIDTLAYIFGAFYAMLLAQKSSPGLLSGTLVNEAYWKVAARCLVAYLIAWPLNNLLPIAMD